METIIAPEAARTLNRQDDRIAPRRVRPLKALRALLRLLANKEDTSQVFEIMRALNVHAAANGYSRLLTSWSGGREAYRRTELAELLSDTAWVDRFAPGSVGHAYAAFTRSEAISAQGLAEESRRGTASEVDAMHPHAWFARRMRDTHDIWHVLTGYGRDGLGEVCLVAFSHAQTRAPGWALIAMGGLWRHWKMRTGMPYFAAVRQAWRMGRDAAWLPGEEYERLLAEPLEEARARLGLKPPSVYQSIPAEFRG